MSENKKYITYRACLQPKVKKTVKEDSAGLSASTRSKARLEEKDALKIILEEEKTDDSQEINTIQCP